MEKKKVYKIMQMIKDLNREDRAELEAWLASQNFLEIRKSLNRLRRLR